MYPFPIVLVGVGDKLMAQIQPELHALDARVEVGFVDGEAAIEGLRAIGVGGNSGGRGPQDSALHGGRNLFIVGLDEQPDLMELRRLSGAFVGHPILALLPPGSNPALPIAAMRAGAAQVVLQPVQREDFAGAMQAIAVQSGHPLRQGRLIGVAGVTGGCGATSIAINLAYELATQKNVRVILAELSLQVGKLPVYLDVAPKRSVHDLLGAARRLDLYQAQSALTPYVERLAVLAGPHEAVTPITVSPEDVFLLTEHLRQLAEVVVLDVPCTYDHLYFETLAAADKVLLIAEQRVPSIRSLQIISTNLAHKRPHLLINRYDPNMKGFGAARLKELLHAPELLTIGNDYEAVSTAINHGRPLRLEAPKSKVLGDIGLLADRLVKPPTPAEAAVGGAAPSALAGLMKAIGLR